MEEAEMSVGEWIEAYGRAWREKDADGVLRLFTEDAVYRSSPFREPSVGHEGVRAYWKEATAEQEGLDLRFGEPVLEGNRAAVEWWAVVREHGKEITYPGILVLRFAADGRCEELRECWHEQSGRLEPPAGWGG
jgi:ketosteroid isomerase-like protein